MLVDVHAHLTPLSYLDALTRLGGRTATWPNLPASDSPADIAERVNLMDEAGVDVQVLSLTAGPYLANREAGAEASRIANETFGEVVRSRRSRFRALIQLPLPYVDASLREIEYGFNTLHAVGVAMGCSILDRSAADDEFEPIWEELDRREAVVVFHPVQNGIGSGYLNDYGFTVSMGASVEDSVIVAHLIAKQVPTRYPGIRFVVPHAGGIIPMLLERLDNQYGSQHPELVEPPSVTARRFYYDTVTHGSQAALLCAWRAFGAERLLTGSDYPVLLPYEGYRPTFDYIRSSAIPADDVLRILDLNAAELLGLRDDSTR